MIEKVSGAAYFMRDARRIEDLESFRSDCIKKRASSRPYIIEKVIELSKIAYDNFSSDLLVERQFISDNIHLMSSRADDVWHCLLVVQKGNPDTGILVISKNTDYPILTALYKKHPNLRRA